MPRQRKNQRLTVLAVALATAMAGCAPQRPVGTILVLVDTLRADHLSVNGYGRATSPTLDAWAAEGLVFERALESPGYLQN